MPPTLNDGLTVAVNVKWLIGIIALLMGLASSSGVLLYQVSELRKDTARLEVQQQASERAIIETVTTLKVKKVID
jgi:hypothetical protein